MAQHVSSIYSPQYTLMLFVQQANTWDEAFHVIHISRHDQQTLTNGGGDTEQGFFQIF